LVISLKETLFCWFIPYFLASFFFLNAFLAQNFTRFLHVELVDMVDLADGSDSCGPCGEPGVHRGVSVGFWHGSTGEIGEVESEVACEV
jgi:hypothetical protein